MALPLSQTRSKQSVTSPTANPAQVASLSRHGELLPPVHPPLYHADALPLHSLLASSHTKSQTLTWTDPALAAFNATKETLANTTLLSYPQPDAPTCLMTDASDTAVGAVLQQYMTVHGGPFPSSPRRCPRRRRATAPLTGSC